MVPAPFPLRKPASSLTHNYSKTWREFTRQLDNFERKRKRNLQVDLSGIGQRIADLLAGGRKPVAGRRLPVQKVAYLDYSWEFSF